MLGTWWQWSVPDCREDGRRDPVSREHGQELLWSGQTQVRAEKSFNRKWCLHLYSDPLMARLIKKAGTSMVALGDIGDSLGNRVRPRCQGLVSQDLPLAPHPCSKPLVVLVIVVIVIAMIIVICTLCSFPRSSSNSPLSRPTSYYIRSSSSTPIFHSYTL